MLYMKSFTKASKPKKNRRVLSGGKPAERKKSSGLNSSFFKTSGNGTSHGKRKGSGSDKKKSSFPTFTPWKVILASICIGICGLLYISHVFSTQQTLAEVKQLENEFNRSQRLYNEKRLEYDRMVGPKEIYQQARQQGFINAGPADQVIHIKR